MAPTEASELAKVASTLKARQLLIEHKQVQGAHRGSQSRPQIILGPELSHTSPVTQQFVAIVLLTICVRCMAYVSYSAAMHIFLYTPQLWLRRLASHNN